MKSSDGFFSHHYCTNMGLPCCIEGPPPVFSLWAPHKLKLCRPKTRKLQNYRLKHSDFTCSDLTCIFDTFSKFTKGEKRDEKFRRFF